MTSPVADVFGMCVHSLWGRFNARMPLGAAHSGLTRSRVRPAVIRGGIHGVFRCGSLALSRRPPRSTRRWGGTPVTRRCCCLVRGRRRTTGRRGGHRIRAAGNASRPQLFGFKCRHDKSPGSRRGIRMGNVVRGIFCDFKRRGRTLLQPPEQGKTESRDRTAGNRGCLPHDVRNPCPHNCLWRPLAVELPLHCGDVCRRGSATSADKAGRSVDPGHRRLGVRRRRFIASCSPFSAGLLEARVCVDPHGPFKVHRSQLVQGTRNGRDR